MAAQINCHRYGTKVRRCHLMYRPQRCFVGCTLRCWSYWLLLWHMDKEVLSITDRIFGTHFHWQFVIRRHHWLSFAGILKAVMFSEHCDTFPFELLWNRRITIRYIPRFKFWEFPFPHTDPWKISNIPVAMVYILTSAKVNFDLWCTLARPETVNLIDSRKFRARIAPTLLRAYSSGASFLIIVVYY